jgi:hypothetical protein
MSRASAAVRDFFIESLDRYLPRRTKRLLFLASFSARVKGEPNFDSETLRKLNHLMALSATDEALKLPVHLSRAIWQGKTMPEICGENVLEGQLTPDRIERVTTNIVSFMPKWLRYGRQEDIERDVKQLLVHHQILAV